MSRAILPVAFVLCVLFIVSCGGDSGTNPQPRDPSGFTAKYKRGEYLGTNVCRREDDGVTYESVYEYKLWLDWWTDNTTGVDSVLFGVPTRGSVWDGLGRCILDELRYGTRHGDEDDGDWIDYWQGGIRSWDDAAAMYACLEIWVEVGATEAQPPFYAAVFWSDGTDSMYECLPGKR